MDQSHSNLYLGTSGWAYKHWKGIFYPDNLPQTRWLEFFCNKFQTVEINATFYHIPSFQTVQSWNNRSPSDFTFSVKMSRLVSHIKKLKNCENELAWFFSVLKPLYSKSGVVLIQLPPVIKFDPGRINEFCSLLPEDLKFAFEFRNISWYNDETYQLLNRWGHTFCIHDMPGIETGKIVTSDSIYIRFHGFDSAYGGDYPEPVLKTWAEWIKSQLDNGINIFGYFNNDIGGFAVKNCITLKRMTTSQQK